MRTDTTITTAADKIYMRTYSTGALLQYTLYIIWHPESSSKGCPGIEVATVAYIARILCVYYIIYGCRRTQIRQRRRRRLLGSRRVYRVARPEGEVASPRENYLLGSTFLRDARAGWSFADSRRRTLQSASRINSFGQLAGSDAILLFVISHSLSVSVSNLRSNNTDLSHAKCDFISSSARGPKPLLF